MPLFRTLCGVWLLLLTSVGHAHAQLLTANDDSFEVPFAMTLSIDAFGVLDNDTLDDEAAGESGATARRSTVTIVSSTRQSLASPRPRQP
jgi:hypothetical protein